MPISPREVNTLKSAVKVLAEHGREAAEALAEEIIHGYVERDDYEEAAAQMEAVAEIVNDA